MSKQEDSGENIYGMRENYFSESIVFISEAQFGVKTKRLRNKL